MNAYDDEIEAAEPVVTEYRLMSRDQLMSQPPVKWRVKGLLPETGLAIFYGASMSGKSFLVVDAALAIAQGVHWFGHRTRQAKVVYFPLEGSGTQSRLLAWESAQKQPIPDSFKVVDRKAFNLLEAADVDGIIKAVKSFSESGCVVIIDTLARAAAGADENSSREMGEVVEAADRIASETAGLVVLVHHSGKADAAGMRGSSALLAAADVVVKVARSAAGARTWRSDKVKDGEDGAVQNFQLVSTEIGRDEDGDPITSCTVAQCEAEPETGTGRGGNQLLVLEAIKKALSVARDDVTYAPPGVKALAKAELGKVCREALKAAGAAPKDWTQTVTSLIKRGDLMTAGPKKHGAGWMPNLESVVWVA